MDELRRKIVTELLISPSAGCTAVSRHAAEIYADRILAMLKDEGVLKEDGDERLVD